MFLWRDISDRYCCVHTHMFINLTSLLSHIVFPLPIMLFYFLISLNLLQGHSRLRADKVARSLHLMIPPLFQYSHEKVSLYSTLFKLIFGSQLTSICLFCSNFVYLYISPKANKLLDLIADKWPCWMHDFFVTVLTVVKLSALSYEALTILSCCLGHADHSQGLNPI